MLGESLNAFRVDPECIHVCQVCPLAILKRTHFQTVLFNLQINAECSHLTCSLNFHDCFRSFPKQDNKTLNPDMLINIIW